MCAYERGWALARDQLAGGVAQQLLVGGEREVHGVNFAQRAARTSLAGA